MTNNERTFLNITLACIQDTIDNFVKSFDSEYSAHMGEDNYANIITNEISYSLLSQEKVEREFCENFYKTSPLAKTLDLNPLTLTILHEIGHLETIDEMEDDTEIRDTLTSNKDYFNLYNERIATQWASDFIYFETKAVKKFDENLTFFLYSLYETVVA